MWVVGGRGTDEWRCSRTGREGYVQERLLVYSSVFLEGERCMPLGVKFWAEFVVKELTMSYYS